MKEQGKGIQCILCGEHKEDSRAKLCDRCWELKTRIELNRELALKILFPQDEGGLLSDEKLCSYCDDYSCELWDEDGYSTCSKFQDLTELAQAQHALDQHHEANALKEQMERVFQVIDRQINSYKDNNPFWINKVTVLEYIKDNIKSELEGENG